MPTMLSEIKRAQELVGEYALDCVRSPDKCSVGEVGVLEILGKRTSDKSSEGSDESNTSLLPIDLGTEPPAGQQGPGTIDEPYDAGNLSEQHGTMSIVDQLSRTKTKEEIAEKRARKNTLTQTTTNASADSSTAPSDDTRGRDTATSTTTSTQSAQSAQAQPRGEENRPSMRDAPKSKRVIERSVSPGQMPDGTHVKCSGERGEGYTPPSGLGRMASKLKGH